MFQAFIFQQQPCRCPKCLEQWRFLVNRYAFSAVLRRKVQLWATTLPPLSHDMIQSRVSAYLDRQIAAPHLN